MMTTIITKVSPISRTESVLLEVESDELMSPNFSVGQPFRPEHLKLIWVWSSETEVWRLEEARVMGPRLKKDGTPAGGAYGKRDFARRYSDAGAHLVDDTPEWVREAVYVHGPDSR